MIPIFMSAPCPFRCPPHSMNINDVRFDVHRSAEGMAFVTDSTSSGPERDNRRGLCFREKLAETECHHSRHSPEAARSSRIGSPKVAASPHIFPAFIKSEFFKSCATVLRISRESCWSDTAREIPMAPTSVAMSQDFMRTCRGLVMLISGTNPSCNQLKGLPNNLGGNGPS